MSHPAVSSEALQIAIATIRESLDSASRGLPEDLFLLVSSLTPMINVDLLIKDSVGRNLLTWRHDRFYGPGWHLPGGIVRFKESIGSRIAAVALSELEVEVDFEPVPIHMAEITHPTRDIRGHFISLLYACTLRITPDEAGRFKPDAPRAGDWQWHIGAPHDLILQHRIYNRFLEASCPA